MKKRLPAILFALLLTKAHATNYYLANSGSDLVTTPTASSPWETITKLNTVTYAPGDTVFFKAGDVFRGTILVNQGGNSSAGVVFTSYGTGNNPIISGAEPVSNWTLVSGNYQASISQAVTSLFVDGKEQVLARYPNEHQYLWSDSAQTTYLKDASLPGITASLIAGKVCFHTAQWCWEKSEIAAYSAGKLTYTTPLTLAGLEQYGYFFYDDVAHLDTVGEWYYNSGTQLLYYRSSTDPDLMACEASVYENGIQFANNASYVSISNIAFLRQTHAGVLIAGNTNRHILIDNCYFAQQYDHGVNNKGRYNDISNSYFREVGGIAVFVNATGFSSTIHHNTFRNIGPFRDHGIGMQINLTAINCAFVDSCYIHHNDIDSAGYCGISVDGGYHLVERNIIKNAMLFNNDGAGLKSYGVQSHHITYRNNFVSKSDGNTEGTYNADFETPGFYFDFNVNNCIVQENTFYDRTQKGIFLNSGTNNNSIIGNVVHGGTPCIDFNGSPAQPTAMTGMQVKYNSFFAKDPSAYIVRMVDNTSGYNHGMIDSNYYFQPYNAGRYTFAPALTPKNYSFADWQTLSGLDLNTKSSFVSWTLPTSDDTLVMNQTDNAATINLGTTLFWDLDSNEVCGSITLQPYTSKILIKANTTCTPAGISDNDLVSTMTVFPNPCVDKLSIVNPEPSHAVTYQIVDVYGRAIASGKITQTTTTISVEDLSSGIYFILLTGENSYVKKIMKE